MIIIASVLIGIVLGLRSAIKQKGKALDLLQYATIYAIAFGLLGYFTTVVIARLM